ncbi:hypothetical protein AX17_002708 [Amanita inopinata Kibby_2008]|nr:hypothetical protein AX17_002708 [Amanita inopinata Kibby_2008]
MADINLIPIPAIAPAEGLMHAEDLAPATVEVQAPVPTTDVAATIEQAPVVNPPSQVTPEPLTPLPGATLAPPNAVSQTVESTSVAAAAAATIEEPEPQSPLTQQFTQHEWDALKEFKTTLPDVFQDAYENPKARETPIVLWGVNIDPAHLNRDARVSVILMKFLRARNLSVRDARDMLTATLRWRMFFNVEAAMEEQFPQEVFGQLGHAYGKDKGGRPVVYNVYGANKDLNAVFGDVQRFLRWRVALMERSVSLLDFTTVDQTIQVHDYEGVGITSRDANSKNAAAEATNIFQNHYPELLYKKFFVNVPTFLNWIFWAMKPLISANTLAKMMVVGTGHHAIGRALLPNIDADQLPKRYGGEADAF